MGHFYQLFTIIVMHLLQCEYYNIFSMLRCTKQMVENNYDGRFLKTTHTKTDQLF